jgi:hypothetical protein
MEKLVTHQLFTQKEKIKIKRPHLGLRNLHIILQLYFQLYYQVWFHLTYQLVFLKKKVQAIANVATQLKHKITNVVFFFLRKIYWV